MKEIIEKLIANNQLENSIELLFEVISHYKKTKPQSDISEHYNNIIMISMRLQGIVNDLNSGIISTESANLSKNQVRNLGF